jgi:hypothetical protein
MFREKFARFLLTQMKLLAASIPSYFLSSFSIQPTIVFHLVSHDPREDFDLGFA